METPSCHSNQTKLLIFIKKKKKKAHKKSVKANMMTISIKSQIYRAYGL